MCKVLCPTLLLPLLVGAPAPGQEKERPLRVFVLAGTSNMLGTPARIENVPADLRQPLKDVLIKQKGEWVPVEAGKTLVGNEAVFGRAMAKHLGEPVGIVWLSVPSVSEASPGARLGSMVKQARDEGRPILITGMLLDASFRDGAKVEDARAFSENLTRWVAATRKEIGNDDLPIVMNRGIPPVANRPPYLDIVRKAQDSVNLPSFRIFNCDDVPRGGDKVHFNTEGRLQMGKRFASAMIELMKADRERK
jgi:hypothetical protein